MSGEMIERVAKAIVAILDKIDGGGTPWDEAPEEARVALRQMARAVIETMLDPTDEMLAKGSEAAEICDDGWEPNATWMAMIYAALDDSVTKVLPEAQKTL